jgi:hypothetical protein
MRTPIAGLLAALIITVTALLITAVAATGVALIGLVLSHWFALSQWQGSLIALGALLGIALLLFRLLENERYADEPEWIDIDEAELDAPAEPPIVPWRRQRPTQGQAPGQTDKKRTP